MQRLKSFLFIIAIGIFFSSQAQEYQFESKKAEKLYTQLEEWYSEYDYESILDSEEKIAQNFLGKEDTLAALMNSFLGEAYLSWEGDLEKALVYYEKEMEIREKIAPETISNDAIFNIAYIYDELGRYGESEALYFKALEEEEKKVGKKDEQYFIVASALIDHYINTYQPEEGMELAKEIKRHVDKNSYNEAILLRAYAELYTQLGDFKKAEKNIVEAIQILEETGYYPSLEYVYFLNTLSFIYSDRGEYAAVEEILNRSLDILARLQGDYTEDEISIKSNLATVYREMGLHDQARELYNEVRKFDEQYYGKESFAYALSSFGLGLNAYEAGNYLQCIEILEPTLATLESVAGTGNASYAQTASTLASAYIFEEEYEMAQKMTEVAMKSYEEAFSKDNPKYAIALSTSGLLYTHLNELDKALEYREDELKLRGKTLGENHPLYGFSLKRMAALKWQMNEIEDATEHYLETFNNYFTQINAYFPVLSEEEKSNFYYNSLKPAFEQFNSFVIKNKSEDKELIGLMYDYQLATKGLIYYATNKVRESIINSGDSTLIEKYETWISQKEQLAQLFSSSELDKEVRNKKIDSLSTLSEKLEGELSKQSSVFADNFAKTELTWKDVRDKLKPGEAAVEIIRFRDFDPVNAGRFTDEVFYAALIVTPETTDAPDLVVMRNGKQMESRYLANYRNAIRYRISENYSYRLFWRPISNKIGPDVKKIYFSPDGVYNQISIYTLKNPETKKYTIDEFEIQLVTNTKDLLATNDNTNATFEGNSSVLFGYPNYNMGRVEEQEEDNQNNSEEADEDENENRGTRGGVSGSGSRGARGNRGNVGDLQELTRGGIPRGLRGNMLRYMRSNSLLALLPGTKKEVELIDSLYQNKSATTKVLMEEQAVEDSIKKIKNPTILHIATHGFFLEQTQNDELGDVDEYVANPMLRSGLILAGANSFIRYGEIDRENQLKDDGILTAYEAMNLNLDKTELVILSACETGLGEVKNGEGVFGLQRAFKVAGADAIIMSMWTVDDNATQELMTTFYEEWLTTGDKHKSFIAAQKRIKDKWKDPYFWGAFVMIGN